MIKLPPNLKTAQTCFQNHSTPPTLNTSAFAYHHTLRHTVTFFLHDQVQHTATICQHLRKTRTPKRAPSDGNHPQPQKKAQKAKTTWLAVEEAIINQCAPGSETCQQHVRKREATFSLTALLCLRWASWAWIILEYGWTLSECIDYMYFPMGL